MTTIAVRDGTMAADTQISGDGLFQGHLGKIGRNPEGHLIGACGPASFIVRLLAWFAASDGQAFEKKEGDGEALILRPSGVQFMDIYGVHEIEAPYFASGSGFQLALGAMAHGASAEDAVKAAMAHDNSTGGRITVEKLQPTA